METDITDLVISLICAAPTSISPANGADLFWFDEFGVGVGDRVSGLVTQAFFFFLRFSFFFLSLD